MPTYDRIPTIDMKFYEDGYKQALAEATETANFYINIMKEVKNSRRYEFGFFLKVGYYTMTEAIFKTLLEGSGIVCEVKHSTTSHKTGKISVTLWRESDEDCKRYGIEDSGGD